MYACDLAPPPFTTTTTKSFILVRCSVYFPWEVVFRREVNSRDYFVRALFSNKNKLECLLKITSTKRRIFVSTISKALKEKWLFEQTGHRDRISGREGGGRGRGEVAS